MKTKYIISICFVLIVIAFFVGRATVSTETEIEYIKGGEITGSVPQSKLKPDTVYVSVPGSPILVPMKSDTIYLPGEIRYIAQTPDTVAVFNDYIALKDYNINLFDNNENGKIDVSLSLQYNALQSLDYKFSPIQKVITQSKKQVFQPFVSAGWSTLDYMAVGAGMFYHNFGVEYQYMKGYNGMSSGHMVGAKWKF